MEKSLEPSRSIRRNSRRINHAGLGYCFSVSVCDPKNSFNLPRANKRRTSCQESTAHFGMTNSSEIGGLDMFGWRRDADTDRYSRCALRKQFCIRIRF